MKNQYVGDIGDYGKYGLLRFLAKNGIKIGVNWYVTENDGSSDGKFIEYLNHFEDRIANVKHFFTLLGNEFFTSYGKQFFTPYGEDFFTRYSKQSFTLYGKEIFTFSWQYVR